MEQGARLTAIGMGTASIILLLLTLVIVVVGRLARWGLRRAAPQAVTAPGEPAPDVRDRALAAVVAVSAMLERREGADELNGEAV